MGCGASYNADNDKGLKDGSSFDFSRRNTLVQKPDVSVAIGSGVRKIDKERRIVFIFGKSKFEYISMTFPIVDIKDIIL